MECKGKKGAAGCKGRETGFVKEGQLNGCISEIYEVGSCEGRSWRVSYGQWDSGLR